LGGVLLVWESVWYQVGIAQQWYDELDNLAFSEVADERTVHEGEDKPADQSYQDQRRVHLACTVSVSPGTCEVRPTLLLLQQTTFTRSKQTLLVASYSTCIDTTQRIKRITHLSWYRLQLVASAALYLKISRSKAEREEEQKALLERTMRCQGRQERKGVELLMGADARDLVVTKPLHLRLRLQCADRPAGATNKETICTESSLKIDISLD
jgi:hypothetical protein